MAQLKRLLNLGRCRLAVSLEKTLIAISHLEAKQSPRRSGPALQKTWK